MICATGNFDGARGLYHDPYVTYGTIYGRAEQDRWSRMFSAHQICLLAQQNSMGSVAGPSDWDKRRFVMYTQAERVGDRDGAPATLGVSRPLRS